MTPPAPVPGSRPYVKLFTLTRGGPLDDTSEAHLRFVAEQYGWINSHGGSWRWPVVRAELPFGRSAGVDEQGRTVGDRVREWNPEIILTNYVNGAYTNQDGVREAMLGERQIPLAIAVHDTGAKLTAPLDADATVLRLRRTSPVPEGKPETYPFKASTTDQEYSATKQRYVAWLRLDDEILRIDSVTPAPSAEPTPAVASQGTGTGEAAGANSAGSELELRVRRGIWGTTAVAHGAESVVLQPVYCGSRRPDGREYYLAGLPDGDSPQRGLRYVFMQQRPEFWRFLAERMQETLDDGLTGPWFDCSVSSWINHSNAFGVRVQAPYDVDLRRPLDRETYREYQQRKHDYLLEHFPGGKLYVNWFFPRHYWDEAAPDGPAPSGWSGGTGGGGGGHERLLLKDGDGHQPISGGAIEMYANERYMDWHDLMRMHLDMRDQRFCVVSWIKRMDTGSNSDADMAPDYQLFAYATHLLVYEHDAPLYWGGAWKARGEHGVFTPPDFVYWDLGAPLERFSTIKEAELSEAPSVYRRRFDRGQALVNPSLEETREVALGEALYDVECGEWVTRVTLGARRAKLLLSG